MQRERRTQRAFLPSDLGAPPERRRGRLRFEDERADPRRMNTSYVHRLRRDIEERLREGTYLEGPETGTPDALEATWRAQAEHLIEEQAGGTSGPGDNLSAGVDIERQRGDPPAVQQDDGRICVSAATMEASAKKVSKVSKVLKKERARKAAPKAKGAKKQHPARKERDDVPTCINYRRKLLTAIDRAAKAAGVSRSRFVQETMAKRVGFKGPIAKRAG